MQNCCLDCVKRNTINLFFSKARAKLVNKYSFRIKWMFNISNIKVYFQIARRHYTVEKSKPAFPGFMLLLVSVCQNWTGLFQDE